MSEPLIELNDVSRSYLADTVETRALHNVNLEIEEGQYVAITGPSGSGKSTLLAVLGLLDAQTSGHYRLAGRDIVSLSEQERALVRNREIGFVFQAFNLIGDLTVAENVELPLAYRGAGGAERRKRADEVLRRVGMSHRKSHYPGQLSGGQQQRVAVARAIVGNPSLILADEPTGNLDSANGAKIMEMLAELHRDGATICMVTHNEALAATADRRVEMHDGSLAV
jgi:putative ABC transport system ATP-binding protein